jgi:hypothetical protein
MFKRKSTMPGRVRLRHRRPEGMFGKEESFPREKVRKGG